MICLTVSYKNTEEPLSSEEGKYDKCKVIKGNWHLQALHVLHVKGKGLSRVR